MITTSIQSHLELGNWVVGTISDRLVNQLSKVQPVSDLNHGLTSRSLAYYTRSNLLDVTIHSESKGLYDLKISDVAKSAIAAILNKDIQGAKLTSGFFKAEGDRLKSALDFIEDNDHSFGVLIDGLIQTFLKAENVPFRSASHPHLFGSIILSAKAIEQPIEQLAVSIVHELAHQELFMLNFLDRLVVKKFDYSEIHAPFQGRKRPPIGRLHSLWALYRMVQFERKIGLNAEKHASLLKQNCSAFESQELTDFGRFLVSFSVKQVA